MPRLSLARLERHLYSAAANSVYAMSKIQWEYDSVGRPLCEKRKAMSWQWFEGDIDVPDPVDTRAPQAISGLQAEIARLMVDTSRSRIWLHVDL